jgi:LPXTG-motif cell wall-anchored protein
MKKIIFLFAAAALLALGFATQNVFAQTSPQTNPSIRITAIPDASAFTFMYKVTNPGAVPLNDVTVTDNACSAMSNHLGDINGNNLLDPQEVWIYTCTTSLTRTATDTATVTAYANGLKVTYGNAITIDVASASARETPYPAPGLPNNGTNPNTGLSATFIVWGALGIILAALIIFFAITRKKQ